MRLESGATFDTYEIVRPIGSGGMGSVWLATDKRLGRQVAIKVLPTELTRDLPRIARFEQEARAASSLNHPNVCTIHAFGETADGIRYIAMEYVEGKTLRDRLATTRLSSREALDITIQVTSALSAAHAAGIVHRDIKPENVMLRPDGLVKVLDFGLAKLASPHDRDMCRDDSLGAQDWRRPRRRHGRLYVPEQARGEEVDARSDIWSVGVTLYQILRDVRRLQHRAAQRYLRQCLSAISATDTVRTNDACGAAAHRHEEFAEGSGAALSNGSGFADRSASTSRGTADAGSLWQLAVGGSRCDILLRARIRPLMWLRQRRASVFGIGLLLTGLIAAGVWALVHSRSPRYRVAVSVGARGSQS